MEPALLATALRTLEGAQFQLERDFPGPSLERQPVHVLYGGAHLFTAHAVRKLGALALEIFDRELPTPQVLAALLELPDALAQAVHARARAKLAREPIEDYRVDFEDGYGARSDAEEDAHAQQVGDALGQAAAVGLLPPFIGIRIKALTAELAPRALRTLERVLSALAAHPTRPPQLRITVPKVTSGTQLEAAAQVLDALEAQLGFPRHALVLEAMVETPQALLSSSGALALPGLIPAARGRLVGAHFGAYDYTAALGIAAAHQHLGHPAADFARQLMRLAFAGTAVAVSDGATTTLPLAPHRGADLTPAQREANRAAVHGAWAKSIVDVRRSLEGGFDQGWDLHPAQVAIRHPIVIAHYLQALPEATARLKHFVEGLGQATAVGTTFDDAATGQGLLNFFLRGLACGALGPQELAATGLTHQELAQKSFAAIAQARRAGEAQP